MKLVSMILVAAVVAAGGASASTVSAFDESLDGDASAARNSAVELGSVGLAGDTITVSGGLDESAGDFRDFFAFEANSSFSINLIAFENTAGVTPLTLFLENVEVDRIGVRNSVALPSNLFGTQSAGSYLLRVLEPSDGVTANYSFSIVADGISIVPSAVPLPAGLPLLIGGLGLMGWMRRRQTA